VEGREKSQRIYLALIGDVVASREVQDREWLQRRLRQLVDQANDAYGPSIASKFVLTIGDEFQGLLKRVEKMDELLAELRSAVHPVELRFGLGLGELDTILEEFALGMDGPCFHRARAAVECAERKGTFIEVETGGRDDCFQIYSLLYAGLRRQWTTRQREVIDLSMMGNPGKAIAGRLGITSSAVSQHLRAVEADVIFEATRIWMQDLQHVFASQEWA
jgi:hypothetical protein